MKGLNMLEGTALRHGKFKTSHVDMVSCINMSGKIVCCHFIASSVLKKETSCTT